MTPHGTAPPDAALTAGRNAELERLFREQFMTMFRLATLLGSRDPENVVQEAFMRLHRQWLSLTDRHRAGGYLRITVVNLCRSEGRHTQVAQRAEPQLADDEWAPSADVAALSNVSQASLLARMKGLAPRHREALVLRFWLDLSEIQMADVMGCSPGSVKSHVSRALTALRHSLRESGDI